MERDITRLINKYNKEDLVQIYKQLGLQECTKKTKAELAREILKRYHAKGGAQPNIFLKGVPIKLNVRPHTKKIAAAALATAVDMSKDTMASTLSKNIVSAKNGLHLTSAIAAASDVMSKIRENVRSDERKRKKP